MAFSFDDFLTEVRTDNKDYESWYTRAHVFWKSKSRLHDLVSWLQRTPAPTSNAVYTEMNRVPADAWRKYKHAKEYLVREFRLMREFDLPGSEVPAGRKATLAKVYYDGGPNRSLCQGYGGEVGRPTQTGRGGRLDGRFYWAIEVVYTLDDSIDVNMYQPLRYVSAATTYADVSLDSKNRKVAIPALTQEEVKSRASAGTVVLKADGPRRFNVKRVTENGKHKIAIWDGPGLDGDGIKWVMKDAARWPFRHSAYFEIGLYLTKAGVQASEFDGGIGDYKNKVGSVLPGSVLRYGYAMSRESLATDPTGDFFLDW